MIKIGIIKEGKVPPDERVPLSPTQCKEIINQYNNVEIKIQKSNVRRFKDEEYTDLGLEIVDDLSDCDIIMGVKEVPIEMLIPNKTYLFFSHTIKEQPYNRKLLQAILAKNIRLIDYEVITDKSHKRLIGFGRYAGIVGCYNAFYTFGQRFHSFDLKRAYRCHDRAAMEAELHKTKLPGHTKIVLTGGGRVGGGAVEILEKIGIKKVSPEDFIAKKFDVPVYTQLDVLHYVKRKDGKDFDRSDFYENSQEYESNFMPYAACADIYIAGHFWAEKSPFIFTRADAKNPDFNIKVVADISCDIDGPVASTIRPCTIKDPIYGYNPQTESECAFDDENGISVMAVDNLPCELPKDASGDFGKELIENVLPYLLNETENDVIKRATITENGNLTDKFKYLTDYVKANK